MRSIFWRIFISFWIANLSILALTTIVIVGSIESQYIKERNSRFTADFSNYIIKRYEKNLPLKGKPALKSFFENARQHRHMMRHSALSIADNNGKIFFEHGDQKLITKRKPFELKVKSDNGSIYLVRSGFRPAPRVFTELFKKNIGMQLFLILLASSLVSFLLSITLAKPLKLLGKQSRNWSQEKDHYHIPAELLERRDEIGALARDLAAMNTKVASSIKAQKHLLHDVSHELRAPLSRLQAVAGLIQQYAPDQSSGINMIHSECEKIDILIQRILDYSRLSEQTLKKVPIPLEPFIENLINSVRLEFPNHNINFRNPHNIKEVHAQNDILESAITNILRNACKYTPEDSEITLTIIEKEHEVLIVIRDHGPGISEGDLSRIFSPFYRGGNAMHGDGHGLGLSIALRAIEKHGGTISLKNHPEGGLEARINLPKL